MNFRIGTGTKVEARQSTASVALAERPPVHRPTVAACVPVDKSGRLATKVVRAAAELVAASGASAWTSLHIQIGLGFAHIDAFMPDGTITRCDGTSEAFGPARRDLLQHMRSTHGASLSTVDVAVDAGSPDDVRVSVAGPAASL